MAGFLTDGYFANRPPPGPSRLDVKTARDDDQNSAMSSPRSFVTRRSMDSPELEPLLLDRSAPPPAYSPSPPLQHLLYQGIASQSQQQYNGYGAMSNTPFFEAGQPQSMAPAVVSPTVALLTEDGSEGQARKRRKRYRCRQSLCRRLAKFMLVLSIVLVVCSVVWKVARSTSGSNVGHHHSRCHQHPADQLHRNTSTTVRQCHPYPKLLQQLQITQLKHSQLHLARPRLLYLGSQSNQTPASPTIPYLAIPSRPRGQQKILVHGHHACPQHTPGR